eukprot:gene5938-6877_t
MSSTLNLDHCIEKLQKCEILSEATVKEITDRMKEVLINETNVQAIKAPVTVVGDVHGITLLRGNHESRQITQVYGFYGECMRKYGNASVWKYFTDMFDYLPVAAIIDDNIYCVHGGLSPSAPSIDQIRVLDRFQEVPHEGPLADLMWSDPDPDREGFVESQRGAGYTFGQDTVQKFLKINKMDHILRAHQLCMDGYQVLFNKMLSTIWSAPNYSYRCGNMASIMEVNDSLERYFNTYSAAPESVHKPSQDTTKELPDYFL